MKKRDVEHDESGFLMLSRPTHKDEYITSKIRGECRKGFEAATQQLLALALGEANDVTPAIQIRAIDTLGKYGMGRHPSLLVEQADIMQKVANVTFKYLKDTDVFAKWYDDVRHAIDAD